MRAVFSRPPRNEREAVNEIVQLVEQFSEYGLDGWTIQFVSDDGHAMCHGVRKVIRLPDPAWVESVVEPGYRWEYWWATITHELAHFFIYLWRGGINHDKYNYAVQAALSDYWDLPEWSYDLFERDYHGQGYKQSRKLSAKMVMNATRLLVSA